MLLARAVMENTEHVLIVDPDAAFLERHGLQAVEPGLLHHRVTAGASWSGCWTAVRPPPGTERSARSPATPEDASPPPRPPAGWSARPTGGWATRHRRGGRVRPRHRSGDLLYRPRRGIHLRRRRLRHRRQDPLRRRGPRQAVRETIESELAQRGCTGGVIAVGGDGRIVVAHNSPAMFSARGTGPEPYDHDMTDPPAEALPLRDEIFQRMDELTPAERKVARDPACPLSGGRAREHGRAGGGGGDEQADRAAPA